MTKFSWNPNSTASLDPVASLRSWAKTIVFLLLRFKSCWILNKCLLEKIYFLAETSPQGCKKCTVSVFDYTWSGFCRVVRFCTKASMLWTLHLCEYLQVIAVWLLPLLIYAKQLEHTLYDLRGATASFFFGIPCFFFIMRWYVMPGILATSQIRHSHFAAERKPFTRFGL